MGLVQKSFSDIITFSRSSNATRVGPTGLVEYAPHNLLLQSQTFDNASWTKSGTTIVPNSHVAPDGTVTADSLSGNGDVYQSVSYTQNTSVTFSVYAKGSGNIRVAMSDGSSGDTYCDFNLSTGTASAVVINGSWTGTITTITALQNGWYRCSVSSAKNAGTQILPILAALSGQVIWGAQLSVGPYALDYVPTTSAAVYGPRFDYDGSGVTIVEPVGRNLVTYSEQFDNAGWTKTNATVTANTTTAPDGTVTADLMYPTTTGTYRATLQSNSGVSGQVYTASFYIKSAGFQWVSLMTSAGGNIGVYFDVINGVKGTESIGTGTITSVGNGWFRCTITTTASSSTIFSGVTVVDANNSITATTSGTSGIYLWGAQLEVGSTATAYMVSGATNGFRAVPVVSGSATPKGLLVEEQRQNVLPASNDFSNVTYWTGGGSVTANATTSPDGTVNAAIGASINPASGVGDATVAISGSIFAKANPSGASSLVVRINRFGSGTDYLQVTFNLSTGVAGSVTNSGTASGGSASMTAFGNGWYRCVLSGTASTTAGTLSFNPQSTCFIYGAQLEAGGFATSLIPTLASAVTRSADVASVNTLSPWFNATEGTLFAEFNASTGVSYCAPTSLYTDANNEITIVGGTAGGGATGFVVITGGSVQANFGTRALSQKIAGAYKLNDFAVSTNGAAAATDTSGTVPSISTLGLGAAYSSSYLNGHLRRIAYFPRRLQNAELASLTA